MALRGRGPYGSSLLTRQAATMVDRALPPERLTGPLIRAARALAGLGSAELAHLSGVSERTMKRAEATGGLVRLKSDNLSRLYSALEGAGVRIVEGEDDEGVGVRLAPAYQPDR